jgi:hypothetical protein
MPIFTWPPPIAQPAPGNLPGVTPNNEGGPLSCYVDTGDGNGMAKRFGVSDNPGHATVDVDFRGVNINLGNPDASVSPAGTSIGIFAPTGDTTNRFVYYRAGSQTIAAMYIGPTGSVVLQTVGLATNAISVKAAADTQNTFDIQSSGQLDWGAGGSSAPDTNLYRGAANQLKTDDDLAVTGKFGMNGSTPPAKAAHPTTLADVITILVNLGACS